MRRSEMSMIALCFGLPLLVVTIDVVASNAGSMKALTRAQEKAIIGGAIWDDATECETGTGGCTGTTPATEECPTGVAAGGICPETIACQNGGANWVCSAPYSSNNPFDWDCVVNSPVDCESKPLLCGANGFCTRLGDTTANPSACGTRTDCSY